MDSDDITTQQAQRLYEAFHPTLGHLARLRARLDELGFPPTDRFRLVVEKAQEAMQHLSVELHYMSCSTGVGRKPRS